TISLPSGETSSDSHVPVVRSSGTVTSKGYGGVGAGPLGFFFFFLFWGWAAPPAACRWAWAAGRRASSRRARAKRQRGESSSSTVLSRFWRGDHNGRGRRRVLESTSSRGAAATRQPTTKGRPTTVGNAGRSPRVHPGLD